MSGKKKPRFPFVVSGARWAVPDFYAISAYDAALHVDALQHKRRREIEDENARLRYRIAGADGILGWQLRGRLDSNEQWLETMPIWSDHIIMVGDREGYIEPQPVPPGLVEDERR